VLLARKRYDHLYQVGSAFAAIRSPSISGHCCLQDVTLMGERRSGQGVVWMGGLVMTILELNE